MHLQPSQISGGFQGRCRPSKVEFRRPSGVTLFNHTNDECILKSAEQFGIDVDDSCRACGACSLCVGNLVSGTVDRSDQSFLNDDQMSACRSLLCVAYATSDLVIRTDSE